MAVINTNYLALVSQTNLNKSQSALGSAIERLSSGLRINSAKDDAAGQAIANRFTANVKGLTQAARNANDGISIAQTTEGALNEINNNLQRIRELSVQAANGTNSPSDLSSIQDEIQQRMDEIDRVSRQTQFNGVRVLAEKNDLTVQVGSNDSETISINLRQINSNTLGLTKLDMRDQLVSKDADGNDLFTAVGSTLPSVAATTATWTSLTIEGGPAGYDGLAVDSSTGKLYAYAGSGASLKYYSATYDPNTNAISVASASATLTGSAITQSAAAAGFVFDPDGSTGSAGLVAFSAISLGMIAGSAFTGSVYMKTSTGGTQTFYVLNGTDYYKASIDFSTGVVTASASAEGTAPTGTIKVSAQAILAQIGTPGQAAVTLNLSAVDAALSSGTNTLVQNASQPGKYYVKNVVGSGDNAVTTYYAASVASTGAVTLANNTASASQVLVDPLNALDEALQQVDALRSGLGAIQNRFESTIANLNNTVNNLSAARSRIEDADYAVEVSNMTRAQILQQAGTAVLAQANQVPQTMLSLLR